MFQSQTIVAHLHVSHCNADSTPPIYHVEWCTSHGCIPMPSSCTSHVPSSSCVSYHARTSTSASNTFLFHYGSSCSPSLRPPPRHNRRHNACTSGVPFEPEPDLHLNPIHVPFKPEGFGTNAIRSTHGSSTTRRRHFEARLDICAFAHVKGACLELHCNQRKRRHACRDGAEPRGLVQGGTCDPPWTMAKGNVRATPDQGTNATVSLRAADAGGDAVLLDDGLSHHCGMRHGSDLTFLVVLQRGKGVSQV